MEQREVIIIAPPPPFRTFLNPFLPLERLTKMPYYVSIEEMSSPVLVTMKVMG